MSEMTPFRTLISREDALKVILSKVKPIERTEKIRIDKSSGRVLAERVISDKDVPDLSKAAMDGFAVIAEDTYESSTQKPAVLRNKGVLRPGGENTSCRLGKGECIRIATGIPLPQGANAVVMIEYTEEIHGYVRVLRAVYPGANVSQRGEDMEKGETVLEKGEVLTPAKVGVLAALGKESVLVLERPRVAVIPTGEEVRSLESVTEPGQVYDVNSYTLTCLVTSCGASVTRFPVVPDSIEHINSILEKSSGYDLIIFSGGSSVGERDLLAKVVEEIGKVHFHGIQIKPGKPTLFGSFQEKPIFGLPGYPTSCLSNAYIFVVPTVRKLAGLPQKKPTTMEVKMGKRVVSSSGREQFLPIQIINHKAYPVFKQSGDITSLAKADGYVLLPVNQDVIEAGDKITVFLFS